MSETLTTGTLTTHRLDTAHGKPVANMDITLWRIYGAIELPVAQGGMLAQRDLDELADI